MIPKIIHYCWFGKGKKSPTLELCLDSWKKHLPDYEIKEWNEENFDLDIPYAKKAYAEKKYAFLSDYARFKILHENGGIYLDTDMLLLKKINNDFLNSPFSIGAEKKDVISAGIIAANKGNKICLHFLNLYQSFNKNDAPSKYFTITSLLSKYFQQKGEFNYDKIIKKENYLIFPPIYFYAFPFPIPRNKSYQDFITKDSIAVHLWEGSWLTAKDYFNIGDCKKGLKKLKKEGKSNFVSRIYWWFYCNTKNLIRPIYKRIKG